MDAFAEQFLRFAAFECTEDPLYVALCRAIALDEQLLALMHYAPPTQARPNLPLAALHERVLAGDALHPFAGYYPSRGGHRAPDAELPGLLRDFAARHQSRIVEHLRGRSTQTNETGRCSVLWPALNELARSTGKTELALFDFGCSAGLNLGVDGYGYDYGTFRLGNAEGPQLHARWHGARPAAATPWRIVARLGADPSPIDVQDDDAVRWLRACLWPHDHERALRLDAAIALARHQPRRIERASDGLAVLEAWLDELPATVQPVLFNSWVLAYFAPEDFARHRRRVADLVKARGLAEISAEVSSLAPAGLPKPPACTVPDPQTPTLWTLQTQAGVRALAWSHGHGRWVEWLN